MKKQIWIEQDDFDWLKDSIGKAGEPISAWVHRLRESYEDMRWEYSEPDDGCLRAEIMKKLSEPHETIICHTIAEQPDVPTFDEMVDYISAKRRT